MCYTEFGREQILAATIPHIEKHPSLYEFTSCLLDTINTSHISDRLWPLTIRHAARHLPPNSPGESTVDREYRVFRGFTELVMVGVLRVVEGPHGKIKCDGDYLPVYEMAVPGSSK